MRIRIGWPSALVAALFYTAGMALCWSIADHSYADTAYLLRDVLVVLVPLALAVVLVARRMPLRMRRSSAVGKPGVVLLVIVDLLVLGFALATLGGTTDWAMVGVVLLGTLFVGIGEETVYRGIVLNSLATTRSVVVAVLGSSVLFGLLHSVNAMLQSVPATVPQVVVTTCIGLVFGWVYVFSGGNLVLCVLAHWLYDFALVASLVTPMGRNPLSGLSMLLPVFAIVITVLGVRKYRGVRWERGVQTDSGQAVGTRSST